MCKQEKRCIQGGNSMVHEDDGFFFFLIYKQFLTYRVSSCWGSDCTTQRRSITMN